MLFLISKNLRRPQAFLLSELVDWMCEKTQRDPEDYCYKRTELMVSPTTWAKTIAIQMAPLGQKKMFGPQTIERLERVSCRVREIAALDEWNIQYGYM